MITPSRCIVGDDDGYGHAVMTTSIATADGGHDDDPHDSGVTDDGRPRSSSRSPFSQPALWRADIIVDFRLRGEERCAAASPAPGFPQVLRSVLSVLDDVPSGPWVDVGGGLGGVASWIERSVHVDTVVLDAETLSLRAANRLFPTLRTAAAAAAATPLRDRCAAVVILSGVVSLLDDVHAVMTEVRRILTRGGVVIVTDLWSSDRCSVRRAPNTFWSVEDFALACDRHGFRLDHVAIADTSAGWWSGAAQQVSDEIDRRYADQPSYGQWSADQAHLRQVIGSGTVISAGVVLRSGADG